MKWIEARAEGLTQQQGGINRWGQSEIRADKLQRSEGP